MEKNWDRHQVWICVFLAVATLAVYAQVYRHDFIDFDDGAYVLDNWRIANGLTANNIIWAFTTGYASNWHPLTWLSHMIDCQVFGLNPGPQHLVNLFLHVANTLLLFLVLRDLTRAEWKSAFVAALFALHPLHVESVAWIAERKDVLSTLFWLLTLWAYTRYVRNPGRNRYLLMLFLFGFGLMAKPMLVTLPFVLLLLDFWPLRRFALDLPVRKGSARPPAPSIINRFLVPVLPLLREKIPLFLLAAASSIITFVVQKAGGAVRTVEVISFDTRIANVLHSYVAYLMKTAWPHNLSIFYRLPFGGYPAWEVTAAAAFLLCVSVLALHFAGRFPYLAVGWFWYLGTLVPVIGLVQVGGQAMADRYTYVPLIGIFVVVVWGVPDLVAKWPGAKRSLAAAGMMMVLACSVTTWFQVRLWRNTSSLFAHALEIDGDNYQAHGIAGTDLALHGKYEEAIRHYLEVLRLQPADTEIMCNLGYAFYRLGKKDQALELYQRALKIKPDYPIALRNMGQALYDQGKFEEAVVLLRRAEPKMPENLVLCSSLGNALAKLGKNQEAIDVYNRVLAMQPAYVEAQFGLGVALAQQGNTPDAVRSFEKALQIKPDYPEIYDTLGNISLSQGRIDEALSHYAEALRLKPDYAEAHYNMGVALYSQGKKAEAIVHYREAIRLKPDYADAFYNLAVALGSQGDFQGAVANYIEAIRVKPDFADAYNNLGTLLFNQGQVQKALDAFTEALRVRPDYAEARRNRDLILSSLGRSKRIP